MLLFLDNNDNLIQLKIKYSWNNLKINPIFDFINNQKKVYCKNRDKKRRSKLILILH